MMWSKHRGMWRTELGNFERSGFPAFKVVIGTLLAFLLLR
jgi:hypothetical protein